MISCGRLKTPSNGTKNGSSPLVGSVATFSCNDDFRLEGSAERTCTEQGEWDGINASCVGECLHTACTRLLKKQIMNHSFCYRTSCDNSRLVHRLYLVRSR